MDSKSFARPGMSKKEALTGYKGCNHRQTSRQYQQPHRRLLTYRSQRTHRNKQSRNRVTHFTHAKKAK